MLGLKVEKFDKGFRGLIFSVEDGSSALLIYAVEAETFEDVVEWVQENHPTCIHAWLGQNEPEDKEGCFNIGPFWFVESGELTLGEICRLILDSNSIPEEKWL